MKKGYLYIILSTILFSTMEIALKISSSSFNPIQMTFLRFLIGSLVLITPAVSALKKRGIRLHIKDLGYFALTGFICVVVSMVFYQLAILNAPASFVAVLFSCNPVFVVLLAFFFLNEQINKSTVISLTISFTGIMFIMNPFKMSASVQGIVLTLLAAITFAIYSVASRGRSKQFGGLVLTCFSFIFGSAEMLVLILITKISPVASFLQSAGLSTFSNIPIFGGITLQNIAPLIYIGVFVTGLGYAFYLLAIEVTNASTASFVFFIKPALAPILALIILKEKISVPMIIGIVCLLAGSSFSILPGVIGKPSLNCAADEKDEQA